MRPARISLYGIAEKEFCLTELTGQVAQCALKHQIYICAEKRAIPDSLFIHHDTKSTKAGSLSRAAVGATEKNDVIRSFTDSLFIELAHKSQPTARDGQLQHVPWSAHARSHYVVFP